MAGRRVVQGAEVQTKRKSSKAGWVAFGLIAALIIGGIAGFCVYTNAYDKVFPGIMLGEEDLSGLTRQELEENVSAETLLSSAVTITADGEELGQRTHRQLGAYIDSETLIDTIWNIGREEGPAGWLKNGWTMFCGMAGVDVPMDLTVYYDDNTLRAAAESLAAGFDRDPLDGSYELTADGLYATKPADGRALDQPELIRALTSLNGMAGEVDASFEAVPGRELDFAAIARELNAEPSSARYDIPTGQVVDGQVGVSLDPDAAAFAMEAAAPGETIRLPAEVVYPEMTAEELEAVLFRDVLGTATTSVSGSGARRTNVRLAGECCNGVILNSEDVFDFNTVVGKRTRERGFGEASAYVNGETVDTVGGGICQVSSTIYYAALLGNLEIVERYAHRYVVTYMPLGMDATVSWGGPEFKFRNDTPYPIRLDVTYSTDNKITVTIMGTKTDDTYVDMTYTVLGTTGYDVEYEETEELDWGTERQKQSPYTGRQVVSYRNIYDGSGKLISQTEEAKSNYKSRNEIILVGTRGKPASGTVLPEPGGTGGGAPELPTGGGYDNGEDEPQLPPDDGSPGLSIFG